MVFDRVWLNLLFLFSVLPSIVCISEYNSTKVSYNGTDLQTELEMRAIERWKNAEKFVHKSATNALRHLLLHITENNIASNISLKCLNDVAFTIRGLASKKFWAYKMVDSSSRPPSGILSGTLVDFGDFDGCLSVNVENRFQGKYCNIRVSPMKFRSFNKDLTSLNLTAIYEASERSDDERLLQHLLTMIHPFYVYFVFRGAVCIPSSCSKRDVEIIANTALEYIKLEWESTVVSCTVKTPLPISNYEIVAMVMISFILFYAAAGTVIDLYYISKPEGESYRKNAGRIVNFLLCFSFVINTKRLLKKDENPESIKIFHGMKFFTILWVILNHTYNALQPEFMSSGFHVKHVMTSVPFQIVLNGYPTVETFFFISGVILMYGRMRSKNENLNVFLYIFRRALRLGPAVLFLTIGFFLFPRISDGPLWAENVIKQQQTCIKYWWANVLYINNWLPTNNMCLVWLWYVGADMQLYIFALIVLIPIKKRPKLGLFLLGFCTVMSLLVMIANHIYYELPPTVVLTSFKRPADIFRITEKGYYMPYVHAITYCIGMATGYVMYANPKMKVPLLLNIIGLVISVTFGLTVVYSVYKWNVAKEATMIESVLYAIGSKIAWSGALSWVTLVCFTGNGGLLAKFLSLRIFTPFSRMTYSTYLVHLNIAVYYFYSSRAPIEARHRVVAFLYIAFVVTSFMTAFVYTQLFESPFMLMEKLIFAKRAEPVPEKQKNMNHTFENEEKEKYFNDTKNLKKPDLEINTSNL